MEGGKFGTSQRRILLELARQTKFLHGSGDAEINSIIKCSEGAEKVIVKNSSDLNRIAKLLDTLKTLNHLVCAELASETTSAKLFCANNSAEKIDAILNKYDQLSTDRIGHHKIVQSRVAAQIRIDLLCSVLRDLEHNGYALRGVIDSIEDEIGATPSDLVHSPQETNSSCSWWKALKCASDILQHELYATIVRLSDIEDKFHRQNEQHWISLDNQLQMQPKKFDEHCSNGSFF